MRERILFIVSLAGRHLCYKTSVSGVSGEETVMELRPSVITLCNSVPSHGKCVGIQDFTGIICYKQST